MNALSPLTKFTPGVKARFLEVLEETCSVKHSAEACGISRNLAYIHRKQDLEFAKDWDSAVERALDDLLGEAHRRATIEKSDRLLEVLLKFRYGDQMADRLAVKVERETGLDPDALLAMAPEDRQVLQQLLVRYAQAEHRVLEHDNGQA
ncbi:hypothetical protein [Arenimonas alkanexedens]